MEVRVILRTIPTYFVRWLLRYTHKTAFDVSFSTEKGRVYLRGAEAPSGYYIPDHIDGPVELNISGYLEPPPGFTGFFDDFVGTFISFEVVPLAWEQMEFSARCTDLAMNQPVVIDYFKELLLEIGKRWPKAREALEARPEEEIEETKKPQVYLPTRQKDLLRWRAVWSSPSFRAELKKGATYPVLSRTINRLGYDLPSSRDTIRKIIAAGMDGRLEPLNLQRLDQLGLKRKS